MLQERKTEVKMPRFPLDARRCISLPANDFSKTEFRVPGYPAPQSRSADSRPKPKMSCSVQTAPRWSAIPNALILTLLDAPLQPSSIARQTTRQGKVSHEPSDRVSADRCSGALAPVGKAQSVSAPQFSPSSAVSPSASGAPRSLDLTYHRPTEKTKLRNYFFDTFGPYPLAGAAILGAINQADKTPPEWGQGANAFGERVGSDFGVALVTTTTRYALAKAFREDTLYYRCECAGVFRRLGHAVISTVTSRRGDDGHRGWSFPAIVAPYAGTMTAVYG
jgi:hypothetical protein